MQLVIAIALVGVLLISAGVLVYSIEAYRRRGGPACVRCGCTDDRACPGGCSWVSLDPPICSRCL